MSVKDQSRKKHTGHYTNNYTKYYTNHYTQRRIDYAVAVLIWSIVVVLAVLSLILD